MCFVEQTKCVWSYEIYAVQWRLVILFLRKRSDNETGWKYCVNRWQTKARREDSGDAATTNDAVWGMSRETEYSEGQKLSEATLFPQMKGLLSDRCTDCVHMFYNVLNIHSTGSKNQKINKNSHLPHISCIGRCKRDGNTVETGNKERWKNSDVWEH